MTIVVNKENEVATLVVEGRIDSNTSEEFQVQLLDTVAGNSNVVIDFTGVKYISSAGLRAILMGQKACSAHDSSLELANVSEMVMEVFETVGFTKILKFV